MKEQTYTKKPGGRKKNSTKARSLLAITKDGTRQSQKLRVLTFLEKQNKPYTYRQLSRKLEIELTAICRVIDDLLQNVPPLIQVAFVDKSPETGMPVKWVAFHTWVNTKPGTQLPLIK